MEWESQFGPSQDSWNAPAELCGPTPRKLKYTSGGIGTVILVFLIVFFGFGIVAAIYDDANQDHRLKQEAKQTDATVTRKWTASRANIVAYEFSTGGQTVRGESGIPYRKWQALAAGSHLGVKYVPSEPAINRPAIAYDRLVPYWVPLIVFVLWIGMIALAVFPLRKERRLLRYGQPAAGVITSHPGGRRPKYGYVVKYEFQLPDSSTVKGKTQRDARYPFGCTVCILYDPKHPRTNAIYPLRLFGHGHRPGA